MYCLFSVFSLYLCIYFLCIYVLCIYVLLVLCIFTRVISLVKLKPSGSSTFHLTMSQMIYSSLSLTVTCFPTLCLILKIIKMRYVTHDYTMVTVGILMS